MSARLRTAILLAAVALPAIAMAGDSAEAWFARMQNALGRQSYQGTIVYIGNGQPMAYRLIVSAGGYARVTALSGPPREIIRGPRVAVRVRANGATMVVHGMAGDASPLPFPPATRTAPAKLVKIYRLELGGWNRVAGENARLVELVARDRWRYGYRVWIGRKSGLPLRSELVDSRGNVLEQAFFTRLHLIDAKAAKNEIGDKALALARNAGTASTLAAARPCPGAEGSEQVKLTRLPGGFHELHMACEQGPPNTAPVTHILVSDGLATVSVFIARRADNGGTLVGGTSLGAVHAVGRIEGGYAVTAMGTVPFATVARIANGVKIGGR